jgi:hypothetical protein
MGAGGATAATGGAEATILGGCGASFGGAVQADNTSTATKVVRRLKAKWA